MENVACLSTQTSSSTGFRTNPPYDIAIIGSGIGGLSAAIALRRAGHKVVIYERYDFGGEVGASISCAPNGSRFLREWDVDISEAKPVTLNSLIRHEWSTGRVLDKYSLGNYQEKFGAGYYSVLRVDLHRLLKSVATSRQGVGSPAQLRLWHQAVKLDPMEGGIVFENGIQAKYDVVICADGVRSRMREQIGIIQQSTPSTSSCYSCLIQADKLRELGLKEFADSSAIQFWGGIGIEKIVMGASSNRDTICCYCFYAAEENSIRTEGWDQPVTGQCLAATFPDLDERVRYLFRNADDTKMWHLYNHNPYPYWVKGRCCLLGDAAHPMMPDQSQGACMAIEDAGALGILFSSEYDYLDITERLHLYELERKPRATRLQESSRRARTDITERIGWSSVTDKPGKLTIEEVCGYDMHNEIKRLVQQFRGAHKA